jgi:hypothetical protein
MNDPNYDDFHDFHRDEKPRFQRIEEFLDEVFKDIDESEDPICRNLDCEFTDSVLEYLFLEWEVDVGQYPPVTQEKAMSLIEKMKDKDSIANVAARIAMEVLPI